MSLLRNVAYTRGVLVKQLFLLKHTTGTPSLVSTENQCTVFLGPLSNPSLYSTTFF